MITRSARLIAQSNRDAGRAFEIDDDKRRMRGRALNVVDDAFFGDVRQNFEAFRLAQTLRPGGNRTVRVSVDNGNRSTFLGELEASTTADVDLPAPPFGERKR